MNCQCSRQKLKHLAKEAPPTPLPGLAMSKNAVTLEQVEIACRHVEELLASGVTENLAIRTLELFTNSYAKFRAMKSVNPDHVSQYKLWSRAARAAKAAHPNKAPGKYLRVEHGTPRRQFAKLVLNRFRQRKLTERWMNALCDKRWEVAVITLEEDARLSRVARSCLFDTPRERWEAAKIQF